MENKKQKHFLPYQIKWIEDCSMPVAATSPVAHTTGMSSFFKRGWEWISSKEWFKLPDKERLLP